jgi:hypothetical protein
MLNFCLFKSSIKIPILYALLPNEYFYLLSNNTQILYLDIHIFQLHTYRNTHTHLQYVVMLTFQCSFKFIYIFHFFIPSYISTLPLGIIFLLHNIALYCKSFCGVFWFCISEIFILPSVSLYVFKRFSASQVWWCILSTSTTQKA